MLLIFVVSIAVAGAAEENFGVTSSEMIARIDRQEVMSRILETYRETSQKNHKLAEQRKSVIQAIRLRLLELRLSSPGLTVRTSSDRCSTLIDQRMSHEILVAPIRNAIRIHHVSSLLVARFQDLETRVSKNLKRLERDYIRCMEKEYLPVEVSAQLELKKILPR